MSKSILIIDTPKSCSKCPCFVGVYTDMYCKALNNRGINYPYPEDFRQDWCPLIEIPEKRTLYYHFDEGWNKCIDKILNT